jgi:hypothetical protein
MKKINIITNWISKKLIPFQIQITYFQKANWVSYHAKKLIRKSQSQDHRSFTQKISEKWFELMHPQRWRASLGLALSLIFIPQLILGLLPLQSFTFIDSDFLTTVWQVLASIIGISFVIVVFLTEYSQDQTYERRAFPIYISATSMIFTVMVGLLTLMSIGINLLILKSSFKNENWIIGSSLWNSILFFLNLTLSINLYIRTYQLLSPSYFRKILITYHRKKVLERVYQELFKRVKQNLSIQYMQELGIEPTIFRDNNQSKAKVKVIKISTKPQIVDDLNLGLLKTASNNAKKIVVEIKKDQIIFWGIPGNNISNKYPEIASISHELNQNLVTDFLSNSIKTKPAEANRLESASEDLLMNRDLISVAIASGQAENVESSLNLYIETIEAFLESLKQLGHRFTPELVTAEDGWFNRWDIFDTVYQQYVSLLREALKSNNLEIINEFISFPRRVMAKAFDYQDHFAFNRFVNLYPLIYTLSKQYISDNQIANQITKRCGLLVAEFANYQIESKFSEKDIDNKEAKDLLAYAENILVVLTQLAKYQIDNSDFPHYRLTIGSMRRLLKEFSNEHDEIEINQIKLQIEHAENEDLKKERKVLLEKEKTYYSLVTNFKNMKRSALFGLGTWICHLVNIGKISGDEFERFLQPINQEFDSLKALQEGYNTAISMEDKNRFNWSSWEMDEWPDEAYGEGKFGSMHFRSWFAFYYTFRALELTPENHQAILEIEPHANIKGLLDSTKASINHFLEDKNWHGVTLRLGNIKLRTEILENSISIAHEKQLEIEEVELTQTPISNIKVKEFFKEAEEAWQEHGIMRNLFIVYGRYFSKPETIPPKELLPLGFYQRIPKGVFIEHPRIGYVKFGESYGRSMARGEDKIISEAFNSLPTISAGNTEFDEVILSQISLLQAKGLNPIILYGHELHRQFFESRNYESKWRTSKAVSTGPRNIDGFYKDVVAVRAPIHPNSVVIWDPTNFGDLVQYKVDEDKTDYPLAFSVKEISNEQAKEYLVNNPELAKHPETGIKLSEEDAIRKIQQDVELSMWQRFNTENINSESGVVITFNKNQAEEGNS